MLRFLIFLLGALLFSPAQSQSYANKPLRIIVPPDTFADHVRREREKWGRLVRERNIVVN